MAAIGATSLPVYLLAAGHQVEIGRLEREPADDTPATGREIADLLRAVADQFEATDEGVPDAAAQQ